MGITFVMDNLGWISDLEGSALPRLFSRETEVMVVRTA
jgi:hypothetical protein